MKISNLEECTTAGSVASVAQPFKAVQQRAPATKAKGSNLLKGIKTSKKFVNSISEGIQQCSECGCAVCECMMTENESTPNTDQILYALTDAARHIANSDAYGTDCKRTISALYDLMRTPLKAGDLAGFEKAYEYCLRKYPDEASELIDTMYQSAKLGDHGTYEEFMSKMHEAQSLGGALNNALSKVEPGSKLDQKIKTHNRQVKSGVKDKQFMMTSPPEGYHFKKDGSVALGEGAKVDRMVGHVKSSEKKLGKSSKEAENIAWATANKRGMLDNKNKKQGVAEGISDTIKRGVKSVKRGMQGWGQLNDVPDDDPRLLPGAKDTPRQLVARNKGYDDRTVKQLASPVKSSFPFGGDDTTSPHSPRGLQKRVLDREMKKRGLGEQGVAEASEKDIEHGATKFRYTGGMHGEYQPTLSQASAEGHAGAADYHRKQIAIYKRAMDQHLAKDNNTDAQWCHNLMKHHEKMLAHHEGATQGVAEADDKKEWQKQNAKPKQLGKTEKYFSTRHTTKDTGAADKEQGVAEGRFVKGPGGVPLDRQGNAIPPKVAAPKVVRTAAPKMNYDKIWFDVTNIISQFFPDGDPADYLPKYCRQHGLTYDDIRKAARKNGYKDEYDYIDQMKTGDYGYNELAEGEITEDDVVLAPGTGRRLKPGLLHKPEVSINPTDTVKLDVPLLIRLLEFAKEDAVDDMALHDLAEKLVAGCQRGRTLSMKDYDRLVPPKEAPAELAEFQEPMSKEEYLSRRKALQQVQMDPTTSRNPALKRELVQKIAALKKRAQEAGLFVAATEGAISAGIAEAKR